MKPSIFVSFLDLCVDTNVSVEQSASIIRTKDRRKQFFLSTGIYPEYLKRNKNSLTLRAVPLTTLNADKACIETMITSDKWQE